MARGIGGSGGEWHCVDGIGAMSVDVGVRGSGQLFISISLQDHHSLCGSA